MELENKKEIKVGFLLIGGVLLIGVAIGVAIMTAFPNKPLVNSYNLSVCQNKECGQVDGVNLTCESKDGGTQCGLFFAINPK